MIEIGDNVFKSKKAAMEHIREILYRYPLNQPLEGADLIFMCDLLLCHPDADSKMGVGVKSIFIEQETVFNKTIHFSVLRTDGSSTDFSFKKCLSPNLNAPIKLFKLAARRVIEDQIISFRDNSFLRADSTGKIQCPITGELVDKNSSHVYHILPNSFDKIVVDFIRINNINVDEARLIEPPTGIGRVFADDNLKNSFANYHKINAQLRVVFPTANLRQKKK
jgi:hypothetical protein